MVFMVVYCIRCLISFVLSQGSPVGHPVELRLRDGAYDVVLLDVVLCVGVVDPHLVDEPAEAFQVEPPLPLCRRARGRVPRG